jgi:hypothetical protein
MTEEAQSPRLLERVREVMRLKHFCLKTEKFYLCHTRNSIIFHNKCAAQGSVTLRSGITRCHHILEDSLQKAVKKAVQQAIIAKRCSQAR